MRRTFLLPIVILLALAGSPSVASAQEEPTLVVGSRYSDALPAASSEYLAWITIRAKQVPLWVQPATGDRYRVNAPDTWAEKPDIEGTLLVYTESSLRDFQPDIRFFDLGTREFLEPPDGVNTADHAEWWPSLSGDLLMFDRDDLDGTTEEIIVHDMLTGESQTIASMSGKRRYFWPGQINGDLVVWTRVVLEKGWVRAKSLDVYVHDLSSGQTTKLANPGSRAQFAASVDSSGTVYYARAGLACGRHSRLMSVVPGGEPTTLVSFDRGSDVWTSYARDNADGSTTVFFDPGTCVSPLSTEDVDIWSIEV